MKPFKNIIMKKGLCWCGSGKPYGDCHKEFDEVLKVYKKQGCEIPSRDMIKNEEQIAGIREAGRINTLILDAVANEIHAGMTTEDIDRIVVRETKKYGGKSACLNYEGYPKSVCVSLNNVVCHGIPSENTVLKEGDIVNVDCTTEINGYFGDSSRMFEIGKVSSLAHKLVTVTKECLDIATRNIRPYSHLGDIGYYVSEHAHKNGFSVVEEFGGHGVGLAMHEEPFVCHAGKLGEGMLLVPGMVFTIEPMINAGSKEICIDIDDGWTIYTDDDSLSAQWEYTLLMTETGLEILSK